MTEDQLLEYVGPDKTGITHASIIIFGSNMFSGKVSHLPLNFGNIIHLNEHKNMHRFIYNFNACSIFVFLIKMFNNS